MPRSALLVALATLAGASLSGQIVAEDELTRYELLAPESHRFAIVYDVTTTVPDARFFFNPIREGSVSTDERVVDRATGKELKWSLVKAKEGKAIGLVEGTVKDEAPFIEVELASPVPKGGERRIRIYKTYLDAKSYHAEGDRIVFERSLSIRRNQVVLPAGYELVASAVPAIVSTEADGRVVASFVNDRDDELPVKIEGRRLGAAK